MRFFSPRPLLFLVSCCNVEGNLFTIELRGRSSRVAKVLDLASTGLGHDRRAGRVYVGHADGVRVLDAGLRPLPGEDIAIPGADTHDVKPLADGSVGVVETSHNRLTTYGSDGCERRAWAPIDGEGDLCHVNSLLLADGRLLTSMFTPEGLGEPWRERLDGAVMEIAAEGSRGGRIIRRGLQQPHSLIEVDGSIWLCESRLKRAVRLPPSDLAAPEVVAEIPGYARGLCVTRDWIAMGQSRSDAHFVRPLVGDEPPRPDVLCGVWFIPRRGGERLFVELPAMEVYDVLLLAGAGV